MVEYELPKLGVAGSNPVARSNRPTPPPACPPGRMAWESSARPTSSPGRASPASSRPRPSPRRRPPPPRPAAGTAACVIGAKTQFKGEITGTRPSLVEGLVEGTIRITAALRVGPGGTVKATVSAQSVVVAGEVVGDCHATERVEIEAAGELTGNIRAPRVVIVEGATFQGNSDMSARRDGEKAVGRASWPAPSGTTSAASGRPPPPGGRSRTATRPTPRTSSARSPTRDRRTSRRRSPPPARPSRRGRRSRPPSAGEILYRAAEILVRRKEDLSRDMTREMGKVLDETRGDVQEAIDMTYYMAGEGRRQFGQTTPSEMPDKFQMSVRQPVGIAGLITPWNFPMAIPSWKMMPALILGNTVVIKPATDTPLSVVNLVKVLEEAGLPKGVVNMVTGQRRRRSARP